MQVIKRDQSIQDYDFEKVRKVVTNAFSSIQEEVPDKFMDQLHDTL